MNYTTRASALPSQPHAGVDLSPWGSVLTQAPLWEDQRNQGVLTLSPVKDVVSRYLLLSCDRSRTTTWEVKP